VCLPTTFQVGGGMPCSFCGAGGEVSGRPTSMMTVSQPVRKPVSSEKETLAACQCV